MPLQQTSGAASYDAFGGGAPVAAKYIEDFFQTWLRTGTGSSTTVTTGLNASINKSLVWTKSRSAATNHKLTDTARGVTKALSSNTTGAEVTDSQGLTAFSSTGYTIGTNTDYNNSGATYVDWQWVATPKFFDVVTYTGNGVEARAIAHSLGSTPGCIIVKRTDNSSYNWRVWHRSTNSGTGNAFLSLNTTDAQNTAGFALWGNGQTSTYIAPTSTNFTVSNDFSVNQSGGTYVAYLFAHNAGGFGLTGTDNVISCGSFTADGSGNASVTLGYEPQWMITKASSQAENWYINDVMRGYNAPSQGAVSGLSTNTSNAEAGTRAQFISSTGFTVVGGLSASQTYIYIAIRRGPMKTPTSGTSVFGAYAKPTSTGVNFLETGFPADAFWAKNRTSGSFNWFDYDRLRGRTQYLGFNITAAEVTGTGGYNVNFNTSTTSFPHTLQLGETNDYNTNANNTAAIFYWLRRAPGFFDEVCYTGTGAARTVTHNLGVAPELMLVKQRTASPVGSPFTVYSATMGNTGVMFLNSDGGNAGPDTQWNSTTPTASVFSVGSSLEVNQSGSTYVAYLFASCPGVSRVGSYTGTGTTQVINCGFTAGSRFVMIKRVGTGDWYVWDSARGIVAGNDPYLLLNSTAAEVTNTDYIDTASTGFEISSTAPAAINANGGTFIFLAIA